MKTFIVILDENGERLSDENFVNETEAIAWAKENLKKGTECYLVLEKTFTV